MAIYSIAACGKNSKAFPKQRNRMVNSMLYIKPLVKGTYHTFCDFLYLYTVRISVPKYEIEVYRNAPCKSKAKASISPERFLCDRLFYLVNMIIP